jgi:arylsulfatase A-like enzyme
VKDIATMTRATLVLVLLCLLAATAAAEPAPRPNILWISAEDLSAATLGCYGGAAHTPRLDALAAEGLRCDAAFAASPVCAPSRSAIITGVMPTTLGSLPMRCLATPPPHVVGFPTVLRQAGYWCANNAKTDYNLRAEFSAGWDESGRTAHWRNRPDPAQPFFAVLNFMVTHESGLFGDGQAKRRRRLDPEARRDPAAVAVPPWYPDTPVIRDCLAARLELAALLDAEVGSILDQLAADGLADSTIVVFWSDHGEGIPHGKRQLNEHGLKVPLLVRVPARFRAAATLPGGGPPVGTTANLVSLLDLGPTMLDLAGLAVPDWMEGRPFLGPHAAARDLVIGVADRMGDAAGCGRSARDARFRYVRNFLPWLDGDDLPDYAAGVAITGELRCRPRRGGSPARAGRRRNSTTWLPIPTNSPTSPPIRGIAPTSSGSAKPCGRGCDQPATPASSRSRSCAARRSPPAASGRSSIRRATMPPPRRATTASWTPPGPWPTAATPATSRRSWPIPIRRCGSGPWRAPAGPRDEPAPTPAPPCGRSRRQATRSCRPRQPPGSRGAAWVSDRRAQQPSPPWPASPPRCREGLWESGGAGRTLPEAR